MNKKQEDYFDLRYKRGITGYEKIRGYLGKKIPLSSHDIDIKIKYYKDNHGLKSFFMEQIGIDSDEYDNIVKFFEPYHSLWDQYHNEDREEVMLQYGNFMNWWEQQGSSCEYCSITQAELHEIVVNRRDNLTLNNKTKRSKGTLEIDRKNPSLGYTLDNMLLCCPLCNNAKSNLIEEESWREIFVDPMRKYYGKLLGKQLKNSKPNY